MNGASRGLGMTGGVVVRGRELEVISGEKGSVTSFGGRQDIHGDRQDGRESLKAVTFQS